MTKAAKFWVAFAFACAIAALTALEAALTDGVMTPEEWATLFLAFASAGGVWWVKNAPPE